MWTRCLLCSTVFTQFGINIYPCRHPGQYFLTGGESVDFLVNNDVSGQLWNVSPGGLEHDGGGSGQLCTKRKSIKKAMSHSIFPRSVKQRSIQQRWSLVWRGEGRWAANDVILFTTPCNLVAGQCNCNLVAWQNNCNLVAWQCNCNLVAWQCNCNLVAWQCNCTNLPRWVRQWETWCCYVEGETPRALSSTAHTAHTGSTH